MHEEVLLIDIGNTRTKTARWTETRGVERCDSWGTDQLPVVPCELLNEPWSDAVISPVGAIASVSHLLDALSERRVPYTTISSELVERLGIVSGLYHGQGADRVANVVAMSKLCPLPALCVDIGTAITFDLVDENKKYVGGLISPGPALMTQALADGTARLPRSEDAAGPLKLETETGAAISKGCWWGGVAMVNGLLEMISQKGLQWQALVLTGGLCVEYDANVAFQHVVDVNMTFKGMTLVWQAEKARPHAR